MAPIWSIVRDMKEKGIARPTTYFFGALTRHDLFFLDEFRQLEKDCPWFKFVPALSKEPADSGWTGERGFPDHRGRRPPFPRRLAARSLYSAAPPA